MRVKWFARERNRTKLPPLRGLRERHFRHSPEVQRRTDEFPLGLGLGQSAHAELSKPENAFYPGIRRFGEPFVYRLGLSGHGFATQAASFMVAA
jgi:hypothetical protein